MESIVTFLASPEGHILSMVLIGLGVFELISIRLPFLPLVKLKAQLEAGIRPGMPPEEEKQLQLRIKNLNMVFKCIMLLGVVALAVGLFGITR